MRKIVLWNRAISESVELWTGSILTTDITGFGTKLNVRTSNKKVVAVEQTFENITLNIHFGVNGNAYNDYTDLVQFIAESGYENLVLEYDFGGGSVYCDVVLLNAPKTQKTQYNVLNETFVFQRLTPWYDYVNINILTLAGSWPKQITIENGTLLNLEMVIQFQTEAGGVSDEDFVAIKKTSVGGEMGRVVFANDTNKSIITIDAELKEVTEKFHDTGLTENAYDKLDHSFDSFIVIEPGTFIVEFPEPELHLDFCFLVYKEWLVV